MSDTPITQLGRYQVRGEVGRGAMGVVYEAQDPLLERTVAIKTIQLSGDEVQRKKYEARFFQEARAAGRLNHPAIITIYDVGREGDLAYIAMELLPGIDLKQKLRDGPLPLREALTLAAEVAEGLAFAHEHGVEHRDIKPANIMLSRGRAKIMDFGIACLQQSGNESAAGMLLGTPRYMSPEQVAGWPIDNRSDIFSLGSVLYEMLTGKAPFDGADKAQLWRSIASDPHTPPSRVLSDAPVKLDRILDRALAKRPAGRYPNAAEFAAALRGCLVDVKAAAPVRRPVVDAAAPRADDPTLPMAAMAPAAGAAAAAVTAAAASSADPLPGWMLSPRFDSILAAQRLLAGGVHGAAPVMRGPLGRLLRDPDLRLTAMALGAAAVAALLILLL